jgi:hypothetical protein
MFGLLLAAAVTIASWSGDAPGAEWSARVNGSPAVVQFEYRYTEVDDHGDWSQTRSNEYTNAQLAATYPGLSVEQILTNGSRLRFRSPHDAGTLEFDGWSHGGTANGTFMIALNPKFAAELQRRGMGTPTPREQRELTLEGGDYAYLDILAAQGFERPDVGQFVRLLEHGVSADYLKGMAALHLSPHSIDTIVRARDHGVTPAYAKALSAAGYGSLSIDDLIRARDHGVSAEFVRKLKELGYAASVGDLIRLRDHGVSPEYIESLRKRGYTARLSVDDIIKLRDHGI